MRVKTPSKTCSVAASAGTQHPTCTGWCECGWDVRCRKLMRGMPLSRAAVRQTQRRYVAYTRESISSDWRQPGHHDYKDMRQGRTTS